MNRVVAPICLLKQEQQLERMIASAHQLTSPAIAAFALFLAATLTAHAFPVSPERVQSTATAKIKFRLDDIRADGLRGPKDGLVSVTYEFCVPANAQTYAEVKRIDPSVRFQPGSRGRIGCGKDQTLCLGSTHFPHWRERLKQLSLLPYVAEIRECFFE